jgi:hypothetical protein
MIYCHRCDETAPLGEVPDHGEDQGDRGKDLASYVADEVKVPELLEV